MKGTGVRLVVAAGIVALTSGVGVATALPAQAQTAVADWNFDEIGSPPPVLTDDSATIPPNNGTPIGGITGDGQAFSFDGAGVVDVPNAPSLNPGRAGFSYTVTVATTLPQAGTDYDLVRKGLAGTKGGEFKIEIVTSNGLAQAMCLIKDAAGHVGRITSRGLSLADGASHTITCTKTSTSVTVAVDNLTPRTAVVSGGLGSVSNTVDLLIGAKNKAYEDGFVGSMSAATLY